MQHEKPCKRCGAKIWYGILHVCNECPWCDNQVEQDAHKDNHGRSWHKECAKECESESRSEEPRGG